MIKVSSICTSTRQPTIMREYGPDTDARLLVLHPAAQVSPLAIYQGQISNVAYPYQDWPGWQWLAQQQVITDALAVLAIGGTGHKTVGLDGH